jgi:hypothetical protein
VVATALRVTANLGVSNLLSLCHRGITGNKNRPPKMRIKILVEYPAVKGILQ